MLIISLARATKRPLQFQQQVTSHDRGIFLEIGRMLFTVLVGEVTQLGIQS